MKSLLFFLTLILLMSPATSLALAQGENSVSKEELMKAVVVEILEEGTVPVETFSTKYLNAYQKVKLKILGKNETGAEIVLDHGGQFSLNEEQKVKKGQTVVLSKTHIPEGYRYQIIDKYRLNELAIIFSIFFALVLLLSRWKGLGAFLGMIFSFVVIVKYIVPRILSGQDPLFVSITGSFLILFTTIYLAHGFSRKTTIAVISTAITLILTGFLSVAFVELANLSGLTSEDAMFLQLGPTASINFKGLLLGGMIIGFLGVLDDITTSMTATVFELKKLSPKVQSRQIISSALNVGLEHVSSLVNTLVLAYAGASLPLFLFIVLNPQSHPLWFMINTEFIAEEIVRTLAGSIGLLCAVPITAVLSVWGWAPDPRPPSNHPK